MTREELIKLNTPKEKGYVVKLPDNMKDNLRRFDDGYQFGDLSKTYAENVWEGGKNLVTTGGELVGRVAQGVMSVPENLARLGATGVAKVADWAGKDEFANALRKTIAEKDIYTGGLRKMNEALDKNSFTGTLIDASAEGVGQALAQSAINSVTPANIPVGKLNMPLTAVLSGAGGATKEAYSKTDFNNYGTKEKLQNATKIIGGGVVEGISEGLFGLLGVGGNDITDEWAKRAVEKAKTGFGKIATNTLIKGGGEAIEELISYAGNYMLENGVVDKMGNIDYSKNWDWKELGTDMLSAFISSGAIGAGTSIRALKSGNGQFDKNAEKWYNMNSLGGNSYGEGNEFRFESKPTIDGERSIETSKNGILKEQGLELGQALDSGRSYGEEKTGNIKENGNDRGTIRSTKKIFRVNGKEISTYGTKPNTNSQEVYDIVKSAKESNEHGAFVDLKGIENYAHYNNFVLDDGLGNVTVTDDGDIVSVVKNSNSKIKGASKQLLLTALANGGTKLDCYNGFLTDTYIGAGFEPVARVKFNRNYAPENWNYERDGEPDIIVFKHNGDSVEEVIDNYKNYDYTIENLPYMEYDEAIAYRDNLIKESQELEKTSSFSLPKIDEVDNLGQKVLMEYQQELKESKVRNEKGELIELYHGTNAEFDKFDKSKIGSITDDGLWGRGFYFSNKNGNTYGNIIKKVYLDLKNPFVINDYKTSQEMAEYLDMVESNFHKQYDGLIKPSYPQIRQFTSHLIERGHDGVIVNHTGADTEYVAFEPEQIKIIDTLNTNQNMLPSNAELQKVDNDKISSDVETLNAPTKKVKLEDVVNMTEKDAQLPNATYKAQSDKGTNYTSKFYDNVQSSKIIDPKVKDSIEDTSYIRQTNAEVLEKVTAKLEEDPNGVANKWFAKEVKDFKDEDIALGAVLITKYQEEGKYEQAISVTNKLRDSAKYQGRAVQMFSIFQRLTPEGMAMYQTKKLESLFDEVSKKKTGEWVEANKDKYKLTEEDAKFIHDKVIESQQATDERGKQIPLAEIESRINNKVPAEAGQALKTWRRIAMLFNPKTQVRNVVGNANVLPLNYVADFVGAQIDKAIAKKTGVRTTNAMDLKAMGKGFKKGFVETFDDYKRGIRTTPSGSKFEITPNSKSFNENTKSAVLNAVNKKLNNIDNLLSTVLEAGDRPFYEAMFNSSLQGQMKANNVTEPTQEMIDIASNEALQRTWNDSNKYTEAVLSVRKAMNKINVNGFGLGDLIIPFAKTPANLTKAMVEYSPAGVINSLISYNDMAKAISRGEMTAQQQKNFVNSTSKAIAGTMLYAIVGALVQSGAITGSADDDKDVADFEKNVLGVQPYSIKIGDKSFTYNWAQPLSAPFAIMADTYKMSKENQKASEILANAFKVAGDQLVENSFLQGIKELFSAESLSEGLVDALASLPNQFVPTLFGQTATVFDDTKRQTFEYKNKLGTIANEVKSKTPGAKSTLAPQVNTFGEEIKNYGGDNNLFNIFLNPANVSSNDAMKSQVELYNLYQETGDKGIFPRKAPYYIGAGENKQNLSSQDRVEYQKTSGKYASSTIRDLFYNKNFKNLSNDAKVEILQQVASDADTTAKDIWIDNEATKKLADRNKKLAGMPLADYYLAYYAQKEAEGVKNAQGKTIPGSKKKNQIKAINDVVKGTKDRELLYSIFNLD